MKLNVFKYLIIIFTLSSCSVEDNWWDSTIDINPNLPIDSNGYYRLKLDQKLKRTAHMLEGHLMDSPNMINKPIEFLLKSSKSEASVNIIEPKTHPRQQTFFTTIVPDYNMVGDTLTLRSRVYVGIDAVGETRYATNFTKIILE